MKLSTRARYALRAMMAIAKAADGSTPVRLRQVAESTHLSRRYLEQLAIALKRGGLVRGLSGKGGGYLLARSPQEIKVGQIFEAAIGPINIVECIGYPDTCLRSLGCECRLIYSLINQKINQVLNELSLADLSDAAMLKRISLALEHPELHPPIGKPFHRDERREKGRRTISPKTENRRSRSKNQKPGTSGLRGGNHKELG